MNIRLIFKYYLPYIKRYRKSTILVFASYLFAVICGGIGSPLIYKRILDIVSSNQASEVVASSLFNTVFMLGAVLVFANIFYRMGDYAMAYSQSHILKDVADDTLKRLHHHSYEFFSNTFTGTLVAKVRRYVSAFEMIHDQVVYSIWMSGLRLIFGFLVLTYYSWILGMILLSWVIVYAVIIVMFIKKKTKKDLLTAEANSKVTGILSDIITNILNVKMFVSHDKEFSYFSEATDIEEKRRREALNFQNMQFMFQGYFIAFFEFISIFTAVYLWLNGMISVGTIILMQIYVFTSFEVVWNMGRNITRVMRAFAEAQEMVDIFEKPIDVKDVENPKECKIQKGEIVFNDVSFSYKKSAPVFDGLSLSIRPGERVGLVGYSGAGKTTITKLLLRLVDVDSGDILIDGQDIKDLKQDDLRSIIAYVPQDPILFHRTLKENIAYSCPSASDEEIVNVAKLSHSHEFIQSFPHGYDTYVGERGVKLSGGERQRIAIARAMLKDAPILILDEATSSLDSINEKYIQDSFDKLMKGRTTVVIAHRLSTIQKMDRIIVFDKGKIIEDGTHKNLLEKKGVYYNLWQQQSHGFIGE